MKQNITEVFELDSQYSTTRCVTRIPPVIVNKPEDKITSVLFLPENLERKAEGGLRTQGLFKCNQENKPLISVITVIFNGAQFLEQTIKSVIEQTYDNVEYIIIDAGSTDGTLDIVRKYEGQIDYWVSEGDAGISDAFNKGLRCVSGFWVNILNSGDSYVNKGVLLEIGKRFENCNIITGFAQYLNTQKLIPNRALNNGDFLPIKSMISHQASFVPMECYKEFGEYSNEYKVRMDYDLWNRFLTKKSFKLFPKNIKHVTSNIIAVPGIIAKYALPKMIY